MSSFLIQKSFQYTRKNLIREALFKNQNVMWGEGQGGQM